MLSGVLTLALVVAGAAMFAILLVEREVEMPGPLAADKVVLIPKGSGTSDVADLLQAEGVIAAPNLFQVYAYAKRREGQLKAGEFLFKAGTTIEQAIDTLIQGRAIQHAFTVPEGLTSEQIIGRLRENDLLAGTINDVPREGSLLPETYLFERGTTRQHLVNLMQTAARDALVKAWNKRAADLAIKTPQELIILASIVEKETGKGDERARVAGVFLNRLQRRMKLQSDPTIVYGIVGGKGTLGRGILRSEIEKATPYNTYVIEGLPPGPIANPGRAALEAVAAPMRTRDLFFVADGTGGHAFAETLDQHNRNVARWRQIERDRESGGSAAPVDRSTEAPATFLQGDPRASTAAAGATRGFDASEGTVRDPLRNQNWDLSSAKSVPTVAGAPAPAERDARRDGRRQSTRDARRERNAADAPPQ